MKLNVYDRIRGILRSYNNRYGEISYKEAKVILKNDKNSTLIDVRSPQEYKEGHLEDSINLPLYDLEERFKKDLNDREKAIIIYCQTGNRSKKAIEILEKQGYINLYDIEGGLDNI